MKFKHPTLILISGFIPFFVGFFLLKLGLNLVVTGALDPTNYAYLPLLNTLFPLTASMEIAAVLCIAAALSLGFLKGKFVITKSTQRNITRILSLQAPLSITKLYQKNYYLLIAAMMGLGLALNWLDVPKDLRGLVDIAVGCALIQGSIFTFREAGRLRTS